MRKKILSSAVEAATSLSGKFTPGPWSRNINPASKYSTVFSGRNTHVAYVATTGLSETEIEANMALIAAAPALLAACEDTLRYLESLTFEVPSILMADLRAARYNREQMEVNR